MIKHAKSKGNGSITILDATNTVPIQERHLFETSRAWNNRNIFYWISNLTLMQKIDIIDSLNEIGLPINDIICTDNEIKYSFGDRTELFNENNYINLIGGNLVIAKTVVFFVGLVCSDNTFYSDFGVGISGSSDKFNLFMDRVLSLLKPRQKLFGLVTNIDFMERLRESSYHYFEWGNRAEMISSFGRTMFYVKRLEGAKIYPFRN